MKKLLAILLLAFLSVWFIKAQPVLALVCGETIPPDTPPGVLTTYITDCQSRLSDNRGQQATLSSAITYLSNQISLTQAKIIKTQNDLRDLEVEITDLTGKITSIDYSLTDLTKLFVARVRETYMTRETELTTIVAQTSGITSLMRNLEYTKRVRDNDRQILVMLEKSRLDYNSQKEAKEKKQQEVAALKTSLDQQKITLATQVAAKNKLLADTKNDEQRYQSLLSQARTQLAAFNKFVTNQGGASILDGTTKTDSGWGMYYNQRENDWGNQVINGQYNCGSDGKGPCTMAGVGCLVTSMAMTLSYYGKSVTPGDIANQSELFSFADFRQGSLTISGVGTNRTRVGYSKSALDNELSSNPGKPVIVGIIQYGSSRPEHFFVVKAKDGDDYIINDPFPENGMNIRMSSRYSVSSIAAVDRVTVN